MHIGIDVGGTKTLGVLQQGETIIRSLRKKTPKANLDSFLIHFIEELKEAKKIEGVGIGLPGIFNQDRTQIVHSPNLKNLEKLELKGILEKHFSIEVRLENDANCFAWEEYLDGAGKSFKNIVGLTIGTGLGSGIILDGKLFHGAYGNGAEFGHYIIKAGGAKCHCGNHGCWEQYASSQFIIRQTGNNARTVYRKAKEGDKSALKVWHYFGYWLGLGIANIINILEPEAIIIGGSLINAWDFFIDETRKTANKNTFSPLATRKVKIIKAQLGSQGGAIGAAHLFQK